MYDVPGTDAGREWIEIYNEGDSAVSLSGVKLLESEVVHGVDPVQGGSTLEAHGYALFVDNKDKFLVDNSGYSGMLFDSVFSLSNTGEKIGLKLSDGSIIEFTYNPSLGGGGDGNSLQYTSSGWLALLPTPGAENGVGNPSVTASSTENTSTSTPTVAVTPTSTIGSYSSHSSSVSLTTLPELDFRTSAGRDRLGFVGVPVMFEARSAAEGSKKVTNAEYIWNFGDGKEIKGDRVEHEYLYPGIYNVVLNSEVTSDVKAVSRIKVRVIKADISISDANDDYTELKNSSTEEVNIGKWILSDGSNQYILPKDSIIEKGDKVRFPVQVTGIHATSTLTLASPTLKQTAFFDVGIAKMALLNDSQYNLEKNIAVSPTRNKPKLVKKVVKLTSLEAPKKTSLQSTTSPTKEVPENPMTANLIEALPGEKRKGIIEQTFQFITNMFTLH